MRVITASFAVYSGDHGFISCPRDWVSWLRFVCVSVFVFGLSRQRDICYKEIATSCHIPVCLLDTDYLTILCYVLTAFESISFVHKEINK